VPVSMICPAKLKRSTIAEQGRGSVNVLVQLRVAPSTAGRLPRH